MRNIKTTLFTLVFIALSVLVNTGLTSCISNDPKVGCLSPIATNYDPSATIANNCQCRFDGINTNCGILNPDTLIIQPVRQETNVWCWLAVGEMIFRYYGIPNVNPGNDYQCGIVGAVGYSLNGACDQCNMNCGNCVRPAGSPQMLSHMLSAYPKVACRTLYNTNKTLNNTFVANFLAENFLRAELDADRPVIAGINPGSQFVLPGNSQHVALIKGYYYENNTLMLHINDPYPYLMQGVDPYAAAGAISNGDLSYRISFANFVNGLKWNTSWYGIGW